MEALILVPIMVAIAAVWYHTGYKVGYRKGQADLNRAVMDRLNGVHAEMKQVG